MTRRWLARAGAALRLPGLVLALAAAVPAAPGAPQVIVVLPPPPSAPPAPGPERIVLRTIGGDIVIALYPDVAPQTVRQMLLLTRVGVYDTTYFFRADPQGYYLQLSDARNRLLPLTAAQAALIHPLKAEWGRLRHVRGVVSMGRSPHQPDSALTSFMIIRKDAPFLDQPGDTYTIFGRVERGMDVVDALAGTKHDADGNPEFRLTILRALAVGAADLAALPLRGEAAGRPAERAARLDLGRRLRPDPRPHPGGLHPRPAAAGLAPAQCALPHGDGGRRLHAARPPDPGVLEPCLGGRGAAGPHARDHPAPRLFRGLTLRGDHARGWARS